MADDPPAIAVEELTKSYTARDGSGITAVEGISFAIDRGSVVGLLGPNGAGKTTTIKSLLGLVLPDSGHVSIDGIDVFDRPTAAYRRVSAVLEGARNVYWRLTVRENVAFFARVHGNRVSLDDEVHQRYIRLFGLTEKADEPVRDLSLGMKQKTALACAFARRTPILFLDEPTLGLDVETARQLRTELRRLVETENRTVVLSSHDMDTVQELCDRVVILNEGKIVADETVDALIDMFRTQAHRITVRGPLDEIRTGIEDRFDARDWNVTGDRVTFTVVLERGHRLYECMDVLSTHGVEPVSVRTVEPNLEDAFVRITSRNQPVSIGRENR